MKSCKKSIELIHEQSELSFILSKAKRIAEINEKVSQLLEVNLQSFVQVGNYINHQLTLLVANASVATVIRYQTPELLKRLRRDASLATLKEILIKVKPYLAEKIHYPQQKITRLSKQTALELAKTALSIQDPKIKEILLRIATYTRD